MVKKKREQAHLSPHPHTIQKLEVIRVYHVPGGKSHRSGSRRGLKIFPTQTMDSETNEHKRHKSTLPSRSGQVGAVDSWRRLTFIERRVRDDREGD